MTVLPALLVLTFQALAQPAATVNVEVRSDAAAVSGATVIVNGQTHETDAAGAASAVVPPGVIEITVVKDGLVPVTTRVTVAAAGQQHVVVEMEALPELEEVITVSATRTDRRVEDQPMRVEVLSREEIEEKMLMTPGDIVMMLNEMGGMRVQATSPSLGAASVRIQGMRGRYTRFLSDGLPLFGEQVGALGLLQIPPMDLGQVEVIKGVASSLYGAGAMGGVVNLISRRPGAEAEREVLINQSSRGGTDAVFWHSAPLASDWGLTFLGSGHWHRATDVNGDTWADLPAYSRGVFRPRLFRDSGTGTTFFATAGLTLEERTGGTIDDAGLPATGLPYREALDTRRFDAGVVAQTLVRQKYVASVRLAATRQSHDHRFGEVLERDRHDTAFGEVALRGSAGRHTWVAGAAIERDAYRPRELEQFAHTFIVPGIFAQDDIDVRTWLSVSASARLDRHSEYGVFLSPRVSALVRGAGWTSRLSVGTGFFAPSALTEETEAAGLSRLAIDAPLEAERGRSASFDIGRTDGPLAYNLTLFASRVEDPVHVDRSAGLRLANLPEPATNTGAEILVTLRQEPWALTGTYTYVRSRELDDGVRRDAPMTPRHAAGIVGMWEREDAGRVGVEWYYTGTQRLEANPYRETSEPYVIVGVLAERQFGRYRVFINGENLTGVRQTRWDPLLRPGRAPDGRWTVDAWAPLEGRNVNGGVRIRF